MPSGGLPGSSSEDCYWLLLSFIHQGEQYADYHNSYSFEATVLFNGVGTVAAVAAMAAALFQQKNGRYTFGAP